MASIGEICLFQHLFRFATGGASNFALNASNDALTWVFRAPETGPAITKAAIRCGALTGASPTYVLSLQGVDGSGYADGTIKSGSGANDVYAELTPTSGQASTVQEYTFGGGGYNSAPGELLALRLQSKGGTTIDASNTWSFTYQLGNHYSILPYAVTTDAAVNTKRYQSAASAISDGTTWWGNDPLQSASASVTTGSSPVYSGVKFTLPAAMGDSVSCVGVWLTPDFTAAKTIRATLYSDADAVLAQSDFDSDCVGLLVGPAVGRFYWDDGPIALTCGSTYRLVVTCTDGTLVVYCLDVASASHWTAFSWQNIPIWTQGSAGSWAETTTRRALLGPIISDITEPIAVDVVFTWTP